MRRASWGPLILLAAVGCLAAPPGQVWLDQRKSVTAISDLNQRATALKQICEMAAASGDASAVRLMLSDLEADPGHDELAVRCAKALAAKTPDDARRIAKLVVDDGLREKTVAELDAEAAGE